jgi:hypothetical protein
VEIQGVGAVGGGHGGGRDAEHDPPVRQPTGSPNSTPPHRAAGTNSGPAERVEGKPSRFRRVARNLERVPGFPNDEYSSMSEEEEGAPGDVNGISHLYRDETWGKGSLEYDPPRRGFTGCGDPTFEAHHRMPMFLMLFHLFWPDTLLRKICTETNRYATTVDGEGIAPGGQRWRHLSVAGLKAFFAISMLMGLKRQPNMKTYWEREGGFFHCPIISRIFSRDRFQQITKCLHITNPNSYVATRGEPGYDKMGQVRWLVDDIRRACMREWSLGKYVTVDEMMIRYKGSYCPARQYMPNKPEKWGVKVWCLADSKSKFVYNFEIYYGKNPNGPEGQAPARVGEGNMARNVVLGLIEGLEGKGHVFVTDNYFFSIGLFMELANRDIYATGTMRSNRVGLPSDLKNLHTWDRRDQGTLEWKMHSLKDVACAMWKDKKPVLLISTHVVPVQPPCTHSDLFAKIPRRNGAVRDAIHTSPIHLEYTTFMHGVDVAD